MSLRPIISLSYAARRELVEQLTPEYRQASSAHKTLLLDRVVAVTGYARKYAIGLLNQEPEGKRTIQRRRLPRYGPEVQQALLTAWKDTKHICAKRLIPFLPTLVPALERHGHLHLTQESRSHLLQVSATTAERWLHPYRKTTVRGLATTQPGPLLKQQIPIRTFHQWNETQPGFLEADLVAHCGKHTEGSYLYTLTLTDIATGWTECLPVLYKSPEAVLSAFQQARVLFPFPILGLDTDSGGEFINAPLKRYCKAKRITFTRGCERCKADQCFVEQKNGAIVRHFVGFERLVGEQLSAEPDQGLRHLGVSLPQAGDHEALWARHPTLSIEGAIQSYLQEQRANGQSPKTMEWHQTALGLFQQYLVGKCHLRQLYQITESELRGWMTFLRTTPSSKDTARSASTITTYARSARAFCHWLVRKGYLEQTPIVRGIIPKVGRKTIHLIEEDEFERLLLACHTGRDDDSSGERAAARNRAILWVLRDTGMRVSGLCGLRLSDVDREQRALRVKTAGGQERWLTLSPNAWFQVLSHLERYHPKEVVVKDGCVEEDHLFLSEWYRPLTDNAITLLFDRIKKRAGISEKPVSPSVLRDTFAVRYLQAGGKLEALRDLLGLTNVAALKRYERLSTQKSGEEQPKAPTEEDLPQSMPVPHKSKRRRRRSSVAATRHHQPRGAGSADSSVGKESITRAEDDP